MTPPAELPHVFTDSQITRRKRYHLVTDHGGETVHRDNLFGALTEWLDDEGWREYILHTENRVYRVHLVRIIDAKD